MKPCRAHGTLPVGAAAHAAHAEVHVAHSRGGHTKEQEDEHLGSSAQRQLAGLPGLPAQHHGLQDAHTQLSLVGQRMAEPLASMLPALEGACGAFMSAQPSKATSCGCCWRSYEDPWILRAGSPSSGCSARWACALRSPRRNIGVAAAASAVPPQNILLKYQFLLAPSAFFQAPCSRCTRFFCLR